MTSNDPHFEGREMLMLHDSFRREFGLMPGLVRGVEAGDRERAQVITEHITDVSTLLHRHHHGEDANIWPLLLERCPGECAPLVKQMEAQHEDIATIGGEIDDRLRAWAAAAAEPREALAAALDRLLAVLREHLTDEEKNVVPLIEQHITSAEWDQAVEKEAADVDPAALPFEFGMVMYEGDPEVVDTIVAKMPESVRPVIRELAARAFAEHSRLVHGTATPPRSTEL
jgi:hemerythrin-like domain-containing protein